MSPGMSTRYSWSGTKNPCVCSMWTSVSCWVSPAWEQNRHDVGVSLVRANAIFASIDCIISSSVASASTVSDGSCPGTGWLGAYESNEGTIDFVVGCTNGAGVAVDLCTDGPAPGLDMFGLADAGLSCVGSYEGTSSFSTSEASRPPRSKRVASLSSASWCFLDSTCVR